MAFGDFKDLTRRTASDKILCDKAFNFAKYPKYDEYQSGLASIIFRKRKRQSDFIGNTWGADVADMQLISKFNKIFRFLFYIIDMFSKYSWAIPLKNKKRIIITNDFIKILYESNRLVAKSKGCKPNKILVDKGSKYS